MRRRSAAWLLALLAALSFGGFRAVARGVSRDKCDDIRLALKSLRDDGADLDNEIKKATDGATRDALTRQKQYVAHQFTDKMTELSQAGCPSQPTDPKPPETAPPSNPPATASPGMLGGGPFGTGPAPALTGQCKGTIGATPAAGSTSMPVRITVTITEGPEVSDVTIENETCRHCTAQAYAGGQYILDAYFGPSKQPGITVFKPQPEPFAPDSEAQKNPDGSLKGSITASLLPADTSTTINVDGIVHGAGGAEVCRGSVTLQLNLPPSR